MADELRGQFPEVTVEIVEGSGGVFEISVDGDLIYSKKATGEFPADGQIASLIAAR